MEENRGAVLLAEVGSLAVHLRRVVNGPENVEQFVVADLFGIKRNLYNFRMPRSIGADVSIRWILGVAAAIANRGVQNARHLAKSRFNAPETSCAKRGDLWHVSLLCCGRSWPLRFRCFSVG